MKRFFILCVILFCTMFNAFPHNGRGSDLLIKILNQLGACSSYDTLSRFITYKIGQDTPLGSKHSEADGFTVVSADNIDYVHHFAQVCKDSKNNSWHGTSIQSVQPLPSLSVIDRPEISQCSPQALLTEGVLSPNSELTSDESLETERFNSSAYLFTPCQAHRLAKVHPNGSCLLPRIIAFHG